MVSSLFVFMAFCFGMMSIVVTSEILKEPREYLYINYPSSIGYIVNCPMCFGFWLGFISSLIGSFFPNSFPFVMNPLVDGCISSGICHSFQSILDVINSYYENASE